MGSWAYLAKLGQDIRASYWFAPAVLVVLASVLAEVTLATDRSGAGLPAWLPGLAQVQGDGARAVLVTIAQSAIGVAGVMFSMTLVAVSFASSNYGPRLIGNFMRDRGNQISLGVLIATFVYCLLVLRAVRGPAGDGGGAFVPELALAVALTLAFVSVGTVIYFIHHVPETINASNLTAALGRRLQRTIRAMIDAGAGARADPDPGPWPEGEGVAVSLDATGYIQTLDIDRLREIAADEGWFIEVHRAPGSFVDPFAEVLTVWGPKAAVEARRDALCEVFATGAEQTERQNVLFIVDQLVEMIARALSPGVNDPFTAINCLNWLFAGLREAVLHGPGLVPAEAGRVRWPRVSVRGLLARGFGQARAYVAGDPLARAHAERLLAMLVDELPAGPHRDAVTEELRALKDRAA